LPWHIFSGKTGYKIRRKGARVQRRRGVKAAGYRNNGEDGQKQTKKTAKRKDSKASRQP
jgi:hypothetical protein